MIMIDDDNDDDDGDDDDYDDDEWRRRRWWKSNGAMKQAFTPLVLVTDRKDSNKHTLLVIKKRGCEDSNIWKFSDFFLNIWCQQPKPKHILCKDEFFRSDLKHPYCSCCCFVCVCVFLFFGVFLLVFFSVTFISDKKSIKNGMEIQT